MTEVQKSKVKNQNDKSKRKTLDLPSAMILPLLSFRDTVSSCLCEGRRPRSNLGEGDRDCRASPSLCSGLWLTATTLPHRHCEADEASRSSPGERDRDCRAEFTLSESEILRLRLRMTKAKGSQ